jgi:type I restriction enzyme S subunit
MKTPRVSDSEDHITADGLANSATRLLPVGSVLIVTRSGILKHSIPVAINDRPVALNQDLKAVLFGQSSGLLPDYLSYLIRGHQTQLLIEWKKEGATVESLELELIANTPTPLPPLPEQRTIVAFLDRETARIDALIGGVEVPKDLTQPSLFARHIVLLQEYRTALISAAVTGQIDVRDEVTP